MLISMVYSDTSALMRLIATTLVAAVFVFIIILMARIWGQGQRYTEFHHDFLTGATPYVVFKSDRIEDLDKAVARKKDVILWVDARISSDGVVFLLPPEEDVKFLSAKQKEQEAHPETPILKGSKLSNYPWEQINEFYKTTPALKEVYARFPQQRFIVNVVDNVATVNDEIVKELKDANADNRTLIQSETLVVMTSIKEDKPEWVYGTSQADLMRFLSFDAMWILSTTQFHGDVFIAPFEILKRPAFNDDVIAEMRRRYKKVFLGPIETRAQFDEAKRLNADGYITRNLDQLLGWM